MAYDRFYVWREECWGGTWVFTIYERPDRKRTRHTFKSRAVAERMCARMNADYERYRNAMWEKDDERRNRERQEPTSDPAADPAGR